MKTKMSSILKGILTVTVMSAMLTACSNDPATDTTNPPIDTVITEPVPVPPDTVNDIPGDTSTTGIDTTKK